MRGTAGGYIVRYRIRALKARMPSPVVGELYL